MFCELLSTLMAVISSNISHDDRLDTLVALL
jgi:hypothetical protein